MTDSAHFSIDDFLDPSLQNQQGLDENNALVTVKKKRKAQDELDNEPPAKKRLTQKQKKRLKQLQAKVAKDRMRQELYKESRELAVEANQLQYLQSSRVLGGTMSKKDKLKRALLEEKAGLERTDAELYLFKEKEIEADGEKMAETKAETEASLASMFQFVGELPAPTTNLKRKWTTKSEKKQKASAVKKTFFTYDEDESSDSHNRHQSESESESDESDEDNAPPQSKRRKLETEIAMAATTKKTLGAEEERSFTKFEAFEEYYKKGGSDESSDEILEDEDDDEDQALSTEPQFLKVPLSEKEKVQLQRNQAALQRQKSIYAQIGNRDDLFERVEESLARQAKAGVADVFEEITRPGMRPVRKPHEGKAAFYVQVARTEVIEKQRAQLPILMEEQTIMEAVSKQDVLILSGQTGSGKTTQVPQFLFEAGYGDDSSSMPGMIGITEPRRVAAVSMAERVAYDQSPGLVAHQVRYDHTLTKATKIKFMTDGVLLREIQSDFLLNKYSAIIVDEAHERSLNTDILLGLLSRIVPLRRQLFSEEHPAVRSPLKLIIMSATLRVSDFTENRRMFPVPPRIIKIESRQFPVTVRWNKVTPPPQQIVDFALAKVVKIHKEGGPGGILVFMSGQHEIEHLCRLLRNRFGAYEPLPADTTTSLAGKEEKAGEEGKEVEAVKLADVTVSLSQYSATPSNPTVSELEPEDERGPRDAEATDSLHTERAELEKELQSTLDADALHAAQAAEEAADSAQKDKDKAAARNRVPLRVRVLPMYSLLPPSEQQKVFETVDPTTTRVIVVATNIAETSITIPGMTYVLDTGRVKNKHYDPRTGMEYFKVEYTSQASVNQRAGRAGRTGPGHAYRLFSAAAFGNEFPTFSVPEIQHTPIDAMTLSMKKMSINNLTNFPFPTPPDSVSIREAIRGLVSIGALEKESPFRITKLGSSLTAFPIAPRFAKMLLLSLPDGCAPYIIAVVAVLTVGNPLLNAYAKGDKEEQSHERKARIAKQKEVERLHRVYRNGNSDVLTWMNAICAFEFAGGTQDFALKQSMHWKTLQEIHALREQLTRLVQETSRALSKDNGAAVEGLEFSPKLPPPTRVQKILLRQVVAAGLIENVARRVPVYDDEGKVRKGRFKYETLLGSSYAYLHRGSVMAREPPEYVVYHQLMKPSTGEKLFLVGATAIRPTWLVELGLPLTDFSEPVSTPLPKYDPSTDSVRCFVTPFFGPSRWELPLHEIDHPDSVQRYKHFARLFLEGAVFPLLAEYVPFYNNKPIMLIKTWNPTRVHQTIQPLLNHQVTSVRALKKVWQRNAKFYLDVVCLWLDKSKHAHLESNWPPTKLVKTASQLKKSKGGKNAEEW